MPDLKRAQEPKPQFAHRRPWQAANAAPFYPGGRPGPTISWWRILTDRNSKKVEAFTFGGALQIDEDHDGGVVQIESPAPILALQFPNTVSFRLAALVEGLLAQRRAAWAVRGRRAGLDERLARVEPLVLYQACLHALHTWLAGDYRLNAESDHRLEHFVKTEVHAARAAGRWSPLARPLDELL